MFRQAPKWGGESGENGISETPRLPSLWDFPAIPVGIFGIGLIVARGKRNGNPIGRFGVPAAPKRPAGARRPPLLYRGEAPCERPPGGDLFSHTLASAVSSALRRFTSVFGMGTGGSVSLEPPKDFGNEYSRRNRRCQIPFFRWEIRSGGRLRGFVRIRIFRISGIIRISLRPTYASRHNENPAKTIEDARLPTKDETVES